MNDYFEYYYYDYVYSWISEGARHEVIRGRNVTDKIQELLDLLPFPSDELLVYRGQEFRNETINPKRWFSTSSDLEKVLRQHIQEREECCLFKIHVLPGVKRFAVNDIVKLSNAKGFDESEIIVNGKGYFYKDPHLEEEGFHEIGKTKGIRTFETWYSATKPTISQAQGQAQAQAQAQAPAREEQVLGANELLERLDPEEYEFLNNIPTLKSWPIIDRHEKVTNETWEELLRKIQNKSRNKNKKGGKTRKTRKARRKTHKMRKSKH